MRELFLHIGYPKTGTTAIQEFLNINRGKLRERGVLYPETGIERFAHHQIPWVFTHDKRSRKGLTEGDIHNGLKKEFSCNSAVEKILISSEGFIFGMQPEEAINIFRRDFETIKLIVYVRQPFRWIQSDYNQGVKGWRQLTCTFNEHLNTILAVRSSPMDFYQLLSKWASVFGWKNIIIRSYDIERPDITGGFLKILGIDDQHEFDYPERLDSNLRLSVNQLELLRAINFQKPDQADRKWLLAQIQDIDAGTKSENESFYYCASKPLLNKINKINKSNKKLLKYFDSNIFDNDFFAEIPPTGVASLTGQVDAAVLAGIIEPLVDKLLENRGG